MRKSLIIFAIFAIDIVSSRAHAFKMLWPGPKQYCYESPITSESDGFMQQIIGVELLQPHGQVFVKVIKRIDKNFCQHNNKNCTRELLRQSTEEQLMEVTVEFNGSHPMLKPKRLIGNQNQKFLSWEMELLSSNNPKLTA